MTHPLIRCTFFRHAKTSEAKIWCGPWGRLTQILRRNFTPDPAVGNTEPKLGLPAISPATYDPPRRGRAQVKALHILALDLDNAQLIPARSDPPENRGHARIKVCLDPPVRMEDVESALRARGVSAFGWSTWSDTPDWPRHRVLVPLAEPIPPDHWKTAVAWSLEYLGLSTFIKAMDLAATLDVARIYFLPGHPTDSGQIQRYHVDGEALRVPWGTLPLLTLPPSSGPSREGSTSLSIRPRPRAWVRDLGVDMTTLRLAALLECCGIWVSPPSAYQGGTRWRTRCPWAHEHTHGLDDDGAYILHLPARWPIWHCSHSSHQHLGLKDILRFAKVMG